MKRISVGALILAITTWATQGDVIHRFSGTIQATVTEETGDRYDVGQVFTGSYEYYSDSVNGTFSSDGIGMLAGYIPPLQWGFPSDWPDGFEGVFVGDATLKVSNGQATEFYFDVMTDFIQSSCDGTVFTLRDYDVWPFPKAHGILTFSEIRTPDSGATAFLLAGAMGVLAVFRRCYPLR